MRVFGKKISLKEPPAVDNLWCLPDIAELMKLSQSVPSRSQVAEFMREELGVKLGKTSLDNLFSDTGISQKNFKSKFAKNLFRNMDRADRVELRNLRHSVFSKHEIQISNTAGWLALTDHLPSGDPLKKYISDRVDLILEARERARLDNNDRASAKRRMVKLLPQLSNLPDDISRFISCLFTADAQYKEGTGVLENADLEKMAVRYVTSARQDFYLGLLATQPCAELFGQQIFPVFLRDSNDDRLQASMVRSALHWLMRELRYNSWDSFERYLASPLKGADSPVDSSGNYEDGIRVRMRHQRQQEGDSIYAKNKMKAWRKSSCNCTCAELTKCDHRGMSIRDIELVSVRVESHNNWTNIGDDLSVSPILRYAKILDNLQAELVRYVLPHNDAENRFHGVVKSEFVDQIRRFDSYMHRYG